MAPNITAPVEGFSGTVVGVSFDNGKAQTSDTNAVAYFRRHGYKVEATQAEARKAEAAKKAADAAAEKAAAEQAEAEKVEADRLAAEAAEKAKSEGQA